MEVGPGRRRSSRGLGRRGGGGRRRRRRDQRWSRRFRHDLLQVSPGLRDREGGLAKRAKGPEHGGRTGPPLVPQSSLRRRCASHRTCAAMHIVINAANSAKARAGRRSGIPATGVRVERVGAAFGLCAAGNLKCARPMGCRHIRAQTASSWRLVNNRGACGRFVARRAAKSISITKCVEVKAFSVAGAGDEAPMHV